MSMYVWLCSDPNEQQVIVKYTYTLLVVIFVILQICTIYLGVFSRSLCSHKSRIEANRMANNTKGATVVAVAECQQQIWKLLPQLMLMILKCQHSTNYGTKSQELAQEVASQSVSWLQEAAFLKLWCVPSAACCFPKTNTWLLLTNSKRQRQRRMLSAATEHILLHSEMPNYRRVFLSAEKATNKKQTESWQMFYFFGF